MKGLVLISEKIREFAGDSTVLAATPNDAAWERHVTSQFNAARDCEYREQLENLERLDHEIKRESSAGKLTLAELEDIESDLEKLTKWFGRIQPRDYFGSSLAPETTIKLRQAERFSEKISRKVSKHERGAAPAEAAPDGVGLPRLRRSRNAQVPSTATPVGK